jgi:hypothetical protein
MEPDEVFGLRLLLTGKPVCNVSTLAIASTRFDLNLFKSKVRGLGMTTVLSSVLTAAEAAARLMCLAIVLVLLIVGLVRFN